MLCLTTSFLVSVPRVGLKLLADHSRECLVEQIFHLYLIYLFYFILRFFLFFNFFLLISTIALPSHSEFALFYTDQVWLFKPLIFGLLVSWSLEERGRN